MTQPVDPIQDLRDRLKAIEKVCEQNAVGLRVADIFKKILNIIRK